MGGPGLVISTHNNEPASAVAALMAQRTSDPRNNIIKLANIARMEEKNMKITYVQTKNDSKTAIAHKRLDQFFFGQMIEARQNEESKNFDVEPEKQLSKQDEGVTYLESKMVEHAVNGASSNF